MVSFLMHLLLLKSIISGRTPPHLTLTFNEICIFTKASGDLHIRVNLRDPDSGTSKSPVPHYILLLLSKYFKLQKGSMKATQNLNIALILEKVLNSLKILDFLNPFPTGKLYAFICVLKSSSDKMENRLGADKLIRSYYRNPNEWYQWYEIVQQSLGYERSRWIWAISRNGSWQHAVNEWLWHGGAAGKYGRYSCNSEY